MTDQDLRVRHIRLLNILRRMVAEPAPDAEDAYFDDYDRAVAEGKKLLEEEDERLDAEARLLTLRREP